MSLAARGRLASAPLRDNAIPLKSVNRPWGGMALPSSFLLDRLGRTRFWHVGEIDWLQAESQARLQAVLHG